ncbi:Protein of unknown function [Pyronema omphalodes CBS 100304]|uniref:Uncharacterized protein n=1 Tax=Pyronema omphalodes (strain CBS 100304) TaxID=1076935 RepID=U4L3A4_PYROM|nr:Protein of unknown function [Pyronema omphalodes CBS 100304]
MAVFTKKKFLLFLCSVPAVMSRDRVTSMEAG